MVEILCMLYNLDPYISSLNVEFVRPYIFLNVEFLRSSGERFASHDDIFDCRGCKPGGGTSTIYWWGGPLVL